TLKYYQIENGSYTVLNNATEITNSCKLEQIKLIEEFNNIAYKLTASQKEEWEAKLKNCNNLEDLKALASQLEEVKQQIEDDQQIEDEPITVNTIKAKYYNGQKQTGTFYFKQNGKTIATKKVSRTKPGTYYTEDVNGVKGKLVVKVKGTSISSLKAGKKSFTIKVYKRAKANVTGYQLRFSLKSNMKKNRIKTISTKYTKVSNTFKKLKSTKYYVQVRTYKTISGKKYYSAWSKYTTVKVK
ncbi:MAG: hypothetical protein MJ145_02625, partial [Clostridia bacterium]|nr:hypothetical protein [Clostridia bacterium]